MKRSFLLLLLVLCVSPGCTYLQKFELPVQQIFNATFPPTFKGDASFVHKNAWFDVNISVKDLRKVNDTWVYSNLTYHRNDRFSSGDVVVVGKPE